MTAHKKISLALAIDESIFKKGLVAIFKKFTKIEIVGEIRCQTHFLEFVTSHNPDVVLIDMTIQATEWLSVIPAVSRQNAYTKTIVLSENKDQNFIWKLIEAGINGILSKNVTADDLYATIEGVHNGNRHYAKDVASQTLQTLSGEGFSRYFRNAPLFSAIEIRIVECICEEKTNKEIGETICLSTRTVEGYRCNILRKMGVKGTAGIVTYAIKNDLCKV